MPRSSQIIPEHSYPHQMVVINDNSKIEPVMPMESGNTGMLFVISSPKGVDRKVKTIRSGLHGFLNEYGLGPFSLYGQPLLNAYAAFSTGTITGHVLRVTAENSAYAHINLVAKYKVNETTGKMDVKFSLKNNGSPLTNLDTLADTYTVDPEPDVDGFTEVKLLSVAQLGRGAYGNSTAFRIGTLSSADKVNPYKNYTFEVYENNGGLRSLETFAVAFNENAIVNNESIFADGVINDSVSGSEKITFLSYPEGFTQIFNAYKEANPDTDLTEETFDVLLGINKYTKLAIANYKVDTTSEGVVAVNSVNGLSLTGGDDGDFSATVAKEVREAALEKAYKDAFSGITDPLIKSKNRFPTSLILDANYPPTVKPLIAALGTVRKDGMVVLDCGLTIKSKSSVVPYVQTNLDTHANNRIHMIDAYCGKVRDPYNGNIITVTSTYRLASLYPVHFAEYGYSKHVPLAGNTLGVLTGFIEDSIYPVFDEDIDSDAMNELCDHRINFARINPSQVIIRATQTTRQIEQSNLSEANNVFILLDIKRDCEKLTANYDYNFQEVEDIARFNKDVDAGVVPKYDSTQVRSIEAKFDSNEFEAARGILHLFVGLVNKDLVKTTIIEIDVNRS